MDRNRKKRGRPMKGEEPRVRMAFTLTPDNFRWLGSAAKESGVSRSDFLDQIISGHIRSHFKVSADNKSKETVFPRITIPQKMIAEFCKKHSIAKLSLFGSVLTNRFDRFSDIDVLVEFSSHTQPSLFDMATMEEELMKIFGGRKVDLRTAAELSQYFRGAVISSAYEIYHAS